MTLPTERQNVNRPATQIDLMRRFVADTATQHPESGLTVSSRAPRRRPPRPLMPRTLEAPSRDPQIGEEFFVCMAGTTAAAKVAALALMLRSWREVPCGSLSNDDRLLREASRLDAKGWQRVRTAALLPFVHCSDDRWHCHLLVRHLADICRHRAGKQPAKWRQIADWFSAGSKTYGDGGGGFEVHRSPTPTPTLPSPIIKVGTDAARARPTKADPTPTRPEDARQDHERAAAPLPDDWRPSGAEVEAVKAARPDLDDIAIDRQVQRFKQRFAGKPVADPAKLFIAFASKGFGKPWAEKPSSTSAMPAAISGDASAREPDEIAQWRARLRRYRPDSFWAPLWGPRPGEPGCLIPSWLLIELGIAPPPPDDT